jgi:hypothetical protein
MKNHALNRLDIYYVLVLELGVHDISQSLTMGYSTLKVKGPFRSEICLFTAVSFKY